MLWGLWARHGGSGLGSISDANGWRSQTGAAASSTLLRGGRLWLAAPLGLGLGRDKHGPDPVVELANPHLADG
eukprot:6965291-Prymnesium_polylepis.1